MLILIMLSINCPNDSRMQLIFQFISMELTNTSNDPLDDFYGNIAGIISADEFLISYHMESLKDPFMVIALAECVIYSLLNSRNMEDIDDVSSSRTMAIDKNDLGIIFFHILYQ